MQVTDINQIFSKYPNELFWHFFIDSSYWKKNDAYIFDKAESNNYFKSMSTAFLLLFSTIDKPLTVEYLIGLHAEAYHEKDFFKFGMASYACSGLDEESFTTAGLIELIEKIRHKKLPLEIFYSRPADASGIYFPANLDFNQSSAKLAAYIYSKFESEEWDGIGLKRKTTKLQAYQTVQTFIDKYEKNIQAANGDESSINKAIVNLIQSLHQFHPFVDGNGRLFIFLILNKLRIMNHLSPVLFLYPERFSGYSVEELLFELKKGELVFGNHLNKNKTQKTVTIMEYIRSTIKMKVEEEKLLYFNVDIEDFLKHYDENENIQLLFKKREQELFNTVTLHYNQSVVDSIFSNLIPQDCDFEDLIILSLYHENAYVLEKLFNLPKKEKLEVLNKYHFLQNLILDAKNTLVIEFLKKLNLSKDYIVELFNFRIDEKQNLFIYDLLTKKKFPTLLYLLSSLDHKAVKSILKTQFSDLNILQIIFLSNDEKLKNFVTSILPPTEQIKILSEVINEKASQVLPQERIKLEMFVLQIESMQQKKLGMFYQDRSVLEEFNKLNCSVANRKYSK